MFNGGGKRRLRCPICDEYRYSCRALYWHIKHEHSEDSSQDIYDMVGEALHESRNFYYGGDFDSDEQSFYDKSLIGGRE